MSCAWPVRTVSSRSCSASREWPRSVRRGTDPGRPVWPWVAMVDPSGPLSTPCSCWPVCCCPTSLPAKPMSWRSSCSRRGTRSAARITYSLSHYLPPWSCHTNAMARCHCPPSLCFVATALLDGPTRDRCFTAAARIPPWPSSPIMALHDAFSLSLPCAHALLHYHSLDRSRHSLEELPLPPTLVADKIAPLCLINTFGSGHHTSIRCSRS